MTPDPRRLDDAFAAASARTLEFLRSPAVAERWSGPSALPKMSVGALACHLGRQVVRGAELLPVATDVAPLPSADEHYARSAWVRSTSPDDPVNDRGADDAEAALGPDALVQRVSDALAEVRRLLGDGRASDVVLIPWQGWSLRRDDFLLTRLLELVVHGVDLAVSLGVPAPDVPEDAFGPVRDLLVRLAVARHGREAVISSLTRRERAVPIPAF